MDLLREKLDGKTAADLFRLAEAARASTTETLAKVGVDEMIRQPPPASAEVGEDVTWETREELLAAAPQVELTTQELAFGGYTNALIDLPADAMINEDKAEISLLSGERIKFRTDTTDLKEYVRTNSHRNFGGVNTIIYADDTVVVEKVHPRKRMQQHPYTAKVNVILSDYRWIGAEINQQSEKAEYLDDPVKFEPLLLLLRCLSTMRLKEPEPTDPLALVEALGIGIDVNHRPWWDTYEAVSVEEVTGLRFLAISNATHLRVLKYFPNISSLHADFPLVTETGGDCPLKHCQNLTRLVHDFQLEPDTVDVVLGLSKLTELEAVFVRRRGHGESALPNEWFKKLSQLQDLKRLKAGILCSQIDQLASLTECRELEDLHIACEWEREPSAASWVFLTELPSLKYLKLEGCQYSTDLLNTLSELRSLNTLHLNFKGVTIEDLEALAELPNLKTLSLGWTVNIDKNAIKQFRADHPNLKVQ